MRIPPGRFRRGRTVRPLPVLALPVLLAAVLAPAPATAQYDTPPPPAAYALVNVRVVQPDAPGMENVTVVVRNGLVEAMGAGIEVPADARVLEGDSLILYPGFVDAHGEAKVAWPDPRDAEEDEDVPAWS
ncbi:MAG TPA: hypothetical protein VLA43_15075, partial [Longimicrobiales bacterium]|nr:hypothetical protein [Longimicrobiales bacterium]